MTKIISPAVVILLGLGLPVSPAHAQQLARTFVSSLGDDVNNCNRLTPCRTFQRAHDQTLSSGEVTVLDPGGYGAVTITKNISIINDGVGEAGILVSGGLNGITINAGAADAVTLRGLTIKGIGFGGGNGIVHNTGRSLKIENCAIRNMTGGVTIGSGIVYSPSSQSTLVVSNTVVADNNVHGIVIVPTTNQPVTAALNQVETHNNGNYGVYLVGSFTGPVDINVTVHASVSTGNLGGFRSATLPSGGGSTRLLVLGSVASNNAVGLAADGGAALLFVGQSTVTGNTTASSATLNGGAILSYGDNNIISNFDASGPVLPLLVKR